MLPGSRLPVVLPPDFVPAPPGYVDVPLGSHLLLKFGRLDNSLPRKISELNQYLRSLDITFFWNACNGFPVESPELSLDGTARNHSFISYVIKIGQHSKRNRVSIQKYFEEKYSIKLAYPHIPLLRDCGSRMYPLEIIYARIKVY
ncbi:unnamed protein product [Caenorhabditis brenneri]